MQPAGFGLPGAVFCCTVPEVSVMTNQRGGLLMGDSSSPRDSAGSYWTLGLSEVAVGIAYALLLCIAFDGRAILASGQAGAFVAAFTARLFFTAAMGAVGLLLGASISSVFLRRQPRVGHIVRSTCGGLLLVATTAFSELNKHWADVQIESAATTLLIAIILFLAAVVGFGLILKATAGR